MKNSSLTKEEKADLIALFTKKWKYYHGDDLFGFEKALDIYLESMEKY